MDLAFDLGNGASDRMDGAISGLAKHPSWHDLLARMVTAREASDSLAKEIRSDSISMRGSFDDFAADCIAVQAARRICVNPNDLGNCKPGGVNTSPVAGLTTPGGRG